MEIFITNHSQCYTQNQIIEAYDCDSLIKEKITIEVNIVKCFTVLADEICYITSIEQFFLRVCYSKNTGNRKYKLCKQFFN